MKHRWPPTPCRRIKAYIRDVKTTWRNPFVALDFAMVFTLRNGKVTSFQEFTDSAAVNAAYDMSATV